MSTAAVVMQPGLPPAVRRVRAYFAPVNRATGTPTLFDASMAGSFNADAPPAPWLDLGWVEGFARASETRMQTVDSGAPGVLLMQARQSVGATVSVNFERWSKLTLALSCGAQQTNVLAPVAVPMAIAYATSTATFLSMPGGTRAIQPGDIVAVDVDYTGQTGYVGAGAAGAFLASAVSGDVDRVRRVTLNVGRVAALLPAGLQLAEPLLAGAPSAGMRAVTVAAFQDREGGGFFQEWSGLFVMQGEQGDALFFHYPRLQSMQGAAEAAALLAVPLLHVLLAGRFVALPVTDAMDGAQVCCYRSYVPAANAQV
jgi:hypothetical protein